MRSRSIHLGIGTLVMTLGLAACSESAATGPDMAPSANNATTPPGQLTRGETPLTGTFRGEFPGVVCGIPVTVDVFDAGVDWPAEPVGELQSPPRREAGTNVLRFTNDANGQWIASLLAGHTTQEVVQTFGDGSFRIHRRYNGSVILKEASGPPHALSAGTLILEFTVVPTGDGGFVIVDPDILFVAGPREDANLLESPAFCDIVAGVLL